jgi:tetratricopeptide (TPR) repeat protein
MKKIVFVLLFSLIASTTFASSNYFEDGKKFFDLKKYDKSKLSLYQSIIFNPQDVNAYIYLAKIFNYEENETEYEKYLNIALDLDPTNEEALVMQIDLRIKQSDINQSNELIEKLKLVCQKHCSKLANFKSRVSDLSLEKN